MVRYADDMLVLCRYGTKRPMEALQYLLGRMDLHLNAAKTQVVNAREEMVSFLGFEIGLWRSRKSGKVYTQVQPSKASVQAVKRRVTGMTARSRTQVDLELLGRAVRQVVGKAEVDRRARELVAVQRGPQASGSSRSEKRGTASTW